MKKVFSCFLFLLILLSTFSSIKVKAFTPLDRIEEFKITISPRDDASLDMTYELKWRVLNSSIEGPLTWVKIGVANKYVDELEILDKDIVKKIRYFYDDGNSTIRCDLNRAYKENEIVNIRFKFHQYRIFKLKNDEVQFAFKPGYFEEIKVDSIKVIWENSNDAIFVDQYAKKIGDTYCWEDSLNYGERIETQIKFNCSKFPNLDPKKDYSSSKMPLSIKIAIVAFVVAIFFILGLIIFISYRKKMDSYNSYRGYSGIHYFWFYRPLGVNRSGKSLTPPIQVKSGGGGVSSGGHCACACACACAGGGRAGCSRKDFYHTNLEIKKFIKK